MSGRTPDLVRINEVVVKETLRELQQAGPTPSPLPSPLLPGPESAGGWMEPRNTPLIDLFEKFLPLRRITIDPVELTF